MIMDRGMTTASTLWTLSAQTLALLQEPLPARADGHVRCRALYSAVSRGTESLVFQGKVPESEWLRMRAPLQRGAFPFPVAYGYQMVAEVIEGPMPVGTRLFALHPHQDVFDLPVGMANVLPAALPSRRAVLAANMETALNALWDSGAGPGDRIVIIGGGVLGLLVTALAARLPGAEVTLVDTDARRASTAESLGAQFALPQSQLPQDCDVVIHASATPAGLATAIGCAGQEAVIVELSWYGEGLVPVPLGGAFHARRLKLVSSQVGQISPSHRPRWDYARRLGKALELLIDDRFDALLEPDIPFAETPQRLPAVLAKPGVLAQVIRY
jgi:NADPH:quinone reductase-like Zn-dependent oxidoreductase